jgi:rod shape-determining protein MreC
MRSFSPRSLQSIVLVLLAVGLIALALGGYLTPLTRLLMTPLISAQTWLATRYQAVQEFLTAPSDLTRLRQRNAELEAEVARLQAEVVSLQQQVAEVQVLSTLLGFVQANPENEYVTAAVIGRDPSPFLHYVIVNRGSDHGLRRGMPVVTQQGLVGRVAAVAPSAARVQLINDPASAINVRLQQSDAEALLVGDITGEISLQNISQNAQVVPGDVVLTSGLGGSYPPNILIGQVSNIRSRDIDLFQSAAVQPLVDFTELKIVLIIVNFNPIDITPLLPAP